MKEQLTGYRVTYAQNREDIIIAAFFENTTNGFYVDVGANDPKIDSVTQYFYERGWRGINIEPQLRHFSQLKKQRPRDINLNIGVSNKKSSLILRQYKGDGLSTFSQNMKDEYAHHPDRNTKEYEDVEIEVKTLAMIFDQQEVDDIHFMKVDVEGLEYEVLLGNNWARYRPQVICIEANHVKNDWHSILKSNNYILTFMDGLNEYFTDALKPEIEQRFSYVSSVVLGKPAIPISLATIINEQNRVLKSLTRQLTEARTEVGRLQEEVKSRSTHILQLQNELNEIRSLKAHIKKFTHKRMNILNAKIERQLGSERKFHAIVPETRGNLLEIAQQTDTQNLVAYNEVFSETKKIRSYRKVKQIIKNSKGYGKGEK